ncbi:unnamed protein product [Porites evermanni]|uniref:Uncharacterized protein n=1 Tax=Porites evermanni TaxID=104178 RepID=A0ABN8LUV3_9CNID|nr:unnamed protein product [Porites evermanni]
MQSSVYDAEQEVWLPRNIKCLDAEVALPNVSDLKVNHFIKSLDIGHVCQISNYPGVSQTVTGLVFMILDLHLRLPRLHKQLIWFKGNKYHFIFQFSDDRAPETSKLTMSIGTLTCWNLASRQCTLEFQPSEDQSWQSWAKNELNQAATYPSPYANVHQGQLSKMGRTIGNDSNCTWQVPTQERRQEDLEVLSSPVDTT